MMRAQMSTFATHAEDGSRYVCGLNEETAMREAVQLLAATEAGDGRSHGKHVSLPYLAAAWRYRDAADPGETGPLVAADALVDALAGWLAQ